MSNNDKNDSKSMGDLFMQRRAAASSGTRTNANAGNAGSSGDDNRSSGKKSFADIQREQQREQQQHTQRGGQYEYGGQRGLSHQRQQQGQQGGQGQFGGQRGGSSHAVDEYGRLSRPSERGGERDRSLRNDPRNDPRGGGGQRRGGGGNMNTMNSRNSRPNNNPRASLPFEQGIIHTLLDKFGFITCADRDRELFFHYSEFKERDRQGHSDDLNIGDEVEFRVGRAEERGRSARGGGASGMGIGSDDGNEKMSAFDVRSLPKGTIQWETEDEPVGERRRGKVERVARDGNSGREERRGRDRGRSGPSSGMGAQDGMIHIVVNDNDNDDKNTAESEQGQGHDAKEERTEIIFAPSDYKSTTPGHSRLDRNDIVEFTLVTLRRTGKKYARNITLIKSERERQREERERKLLEDALLERGVVVVVRGGSSGGNSNDKSSTGEYGFLKSANRMEEVHFNMSHVLFHDADGEGMEKGNETSAAAISLKEGQEVEFYVVNENSGSSTGGGGGGRHKGGGRSLSARKIKLLPKGSVKFEHVLAEGVTGMVVDCPVAASVSSSPFGGGGGGAGRREDGRRGGSDNRGGGSAVGGGGGGGGGGSPGSVIGKICLERPITINNTVDNNNNGNDNEEEQQQVITQVSLHPSNYPGGTYALSRTGNEIGLWIRPHDVLLFDVVQKVLDGSVWAVPTFRMHPIDVDAKADVDAVNNDSSANAVNKKPARVHLIEPSLCARTAGVVRSVHDNYGFISLAEREGMDAYFPLFEVFPGEVHGDLIANSQEIYMNKISSDNESGGSGKGEDGYGYGGLVQTKGGRINIEVGTEVMLDLSLQMPPPNSGGPSGGTGARGGRYKQNNSRPAVEKESYRARRVQILPKGTIQDKLPIASGVKVKVIKVDARQPFVGTLELEESLKVDTNATREKRYPYVTKLLDDIAKGKYNMNGETDKGVVFHEVLSDKEAQAVISMINSRDDLEWSYVDPGKEAQGHRLCISRKKDSNKELMKKEAVDGMEAEDEPAIVSEASMTSEGSNEQKAKNVALEEAPSASVSDRGTADEALVELQNNNKKRGGKKANKILRMLRFDKLSFPDIAGIGDPLGVGDVLNCDIYQSRRTGLFQAENIMVVSRNQNPTTILSGGEANDARRKDLVGFVSEVVSSRQFGFISQLIEDEERVSKKRGEHVFFHFREIVADSTGAVGGSEGDDVAQDGKGSSPPRSSLSSRSSKKPSSMRGNESVALHKGDEVKFDISQERKNGKLTAVNVRILPRGTLKVPAKAQVAECTGYVLMEPSHTSLANTPSHNTALLQSNATTPASGGGRWANVREDKANKSGANAKEEGVILLLSDPSHLFSPRPAKTKQSKESPSKQRTNDAVAGEAGDVSENKDCVTDGSVQTESHDTGIDINNNTINEADKAKDEAVADQSAPQSLIGTHLRYRLSSVMSSRGSGQAPKRGDLVTFGKARGAKLIKDIRIEKMGAATHVRGILVDIEKDGEDMAVFAVSSLPASSDGGQKDGKEEERYGIKLTEVVSCNKSMLKEREQVDGILHDGKVFGVCRTKDIYLASSFGRNSSGGGSSISSTGAGAGGLKKERPKLNLTVKKEMGGAIMAQSRMAKGPDGTYGFVAGWTKRTSLFMSDASAADVVDEKTKDSDATATPAEESLNMSLSAAASEFVPNFVSPSEEVLQGESDNGGGD